MRVQIDPGRCQGHGRCYDIAPEVFGEDGEGYGQVRGEGAIAGRAERSARLAALNCPEHAVVITEGA